ncbi:hypothetical protein B484DRAFT_449007 [Ochromonadaceae sp. CCMP2298]|nr:hypothetical protein B484DRAFT_449007 [Ochromonadaceae sp. CCMP2298]
MLPAYTEIHTTSPQAAGLPVLEVVRRLGEEKLINREDRRALKDGLYSADVVRRDEIVRALCEVELSSSRFAIRKLKAIIHRNGSGEVSSKVLRGVEGGKDRPFETPGSLKNHANQANMGNVSNMGNIGDTENIGSVGIGMGNAGSGNMGNKGASPPGSISGSSVGMSGVKRPSKYRKAASYAISDGGGDGRDGVQLSEHNLSQHNRNLGNSRSHSYGGLPNGIASPVSEGDKGGGPGGDGNVLFSSPSPSTARENGTPWSEFLDKKGGAGDIRSRSASKSQDKDNGNGNDGKHQSRSDNQNHSLNHGNHSNGLSGNGRALSSSAHRGGSRHHGSGAGGEGDLGAGGHSGPGVGADEDKDEDEDINTFAAIQEVVGDAPLYSGPDCFRNVLEKAALRLCDFQQRYDPARMGRRKFAVLVGGGSFNPLTRMQLRTFFLAKQCLEAKYGYVVLGSLLSPAHGATVRERYRTNPSEILPSPHRLAVAQLLVQHSKLLAMDPWEITRRRAMDYLSLLEHSQSIIAQQFPQTEIKVLYVCKPNMVPKLSPSALQKQNFGLVTVCRTHESDTLRGALSAKWNGVIIVVEDTAILDASLEVTSRRVRDKVKAGESVRELVGERINDYVVRHRLGAKMNGLEKWEEKEKALPTIASRPAGPTLSVKWIRGGGGGGSVDSHATGLTRNTFNTFNTLNTFSENPPNQDQPNLPNRLNTISEQMQGQMQEEVEGQRQLQGQRQGQGQEMQTPRQTVQGVTSPDWNYSIKPAAAKSDPLSQGRRRSGSGSKGGAEGGGGGSILLTAQGGGSSGVASSAGGGYTPSWATVGV